MSGYKRVREIGRGGFGVVEEVTNEDGESFARKTFRPASSIDISVHDKLRQRFVREVKTQTELGGNEIIPVLDSDLSGQTPWFIMPLAEMTYDEQIANDRSAGKIDVKAVSDVLNALEVLHGMGFTHRDLNPKNVLLHDGNWKLSDLGAILPPSGKTVTITDQTIIYTEQYCSPEQRKDFHSAQPSTDIFSFGCILHDIYGTQPRTPFATQKAPGDIGIIIEKCTAQNPAKRPTVSILRELLLEVLLESEGQCKVDDKVAEHWLEKLKSIETWEDSDFVEFANYFSHLIDFR